MVRGRTATATEDLPGRQGLGIWGGCPVCFFNLGQLRSNHDDSRAD